MKFFFHELAEEEFLNTIEYYEGCRTGLGLEFTQEVNDTIKRIIQFPEAWSAMSKNTRRCLINRFPFGIIYQATTHNIYIIAVADLRRKPGYWQVRLK
ncbi:MAG: hypothetical protein K9H64_12975 [Bacteroidales bacterium]|nr:hypothetical protein [Bacteroidales bacterium]MCF8456561.1 hypothetical protein [Bacteroidales bacterium]